MLLQKLFLLDSMYYRHHGCESECAHKEVPLIPLELINVNGFIAYDPLALIQSELLSAVC